MSLLMKALANAEESKRALNLNTNEDNAEAQQAAANIFAASQHNVATFSILVNILMGIIVIGIAWFGYQLYQLNSIPDSIPPSEAVPFQQPVVMANVKSDVNDGPTTKPLEPSSKQQNVAPSKKSLTEVKKVTSDNKALSKSSSEKKEATQTLQRKKQQVTDKLIASEQPVTNQTTSLEPEAQTNLSTSNHNIIVERKAGDLILSDELQRAYQAYISGELTKAKKLYRNVLQKDVTQIDALLGMASIAHKQQRFADAGGWYNKVLLLEPDHPVALAGLAASKPQLSPVTQEQRLKALIRKQPYHAQHYANLGNLYAAQNAWGKAQAAFFEANRHNKNNAQFAFNLAVSLEHLGKPSLAIQHYKRALTLVNAQQLSVPDPGQIQQRIDFLR